jgi:hypothetical protein
MKNYFFGFLILFAISGTFAQVTTSNISGLVKDKSGETVAGANVVATHLPTGTIYGAITNFDGRFNLQNLRIGGPYQVKISFVGYRDQVIENVSLALGETLDLEARLLTDDNVLEEVVITSSKGDIFSSDRTGAATQVSNRNLRTLPTISRSAQDFTRLEPTASGNSFGGRNDQFNNFSLDGAIFNNPFGLDAATPGGQTDAQPISLDAIEQIQVTTAPYDVTLSGFTGASVNAVTKSGTNTLKGTVYGFFRNEDLTGDKINGEKVFNADLEQTQYGFSLGGPIVENKLFFFTNFELDSRTDLGSPWLPNKGTGSVNESRVSIEDMISVSDALDNLGYDTGRFENFNYGSESVKGIFKLDWNINTKHRLAVIYNFLDASKEKPAHPTALGFRGPNATTLQFENSGYEINNKIQSFQVELNSNFSNNISNKLQVGYTHFDDFRNPLSSPAPVITIQDGAGTNYIIAGHEPFSINNVLDQKVFQITNNLNIFLGDHALTLGFSFERFEFKNSFNLAGYDNFGNPNDYFGTFRPYPSVASFLADAAQPFASSVIAQNLPYAQATFESRNAAGTGNDGGWKLSELNVGQLAFYLQDEWSLLDNLKVTAGIRFDKPLYFNTDELIQKFIDTDNGASVDPTKQYFNPQTNQAVTLNSTQLPTDKLLFSPRVGFNWDIRNDKTLQLRGGTGIFTGRLPFVWIGNQVSGADDGFFQIVDPKFQFPQVWRSSLGMDYRLNNGIILTGDFSYTEDINSAHVQNWGLRNPTGTLQGVDNRPVYSAGDKGDNAYVFTNSGKGQVINWTGSVKKTFDSGLYTSIAYSYLNAKDVNSIEAEITGDALAFNPTKGNANNADLSFSKYGDTHRFIAVVSKQWSYGSQKQWGTTISSFMEYAQGGRYNFTYGGDINNDGSTVNDLIYIPTESEIDQMNFTGAGQAVALKQFILNNEYLKDNRGDYFERYGAKSPWRSTLDVKLLQDYNFKVSNDKTNTVQFSIDILNFGNLLNSDWGVVDIPQVLQPIGVNLDPDTNEPTYTFNPDLKNTFRADTSLLSRWRMQVGLRYIF